MALVSAEPNVFFVVFPVPLPCLLQQLTTRRDQPPRLRLCLVQFSSSNLSFVNQNRSDLYFGLLPKSGLFQVWPLLWSPDQTEVYLILLSHLETGTVLPHQEWRN